MKHKVFFKDLWKSYKKARKQHPIRSDTELSQFVSTYVSTLSNEFGGSDKEQLYSDFLKEYKGIFWNDRNDFKVSLGLSGSLGATSGIVISGVSGGAAAGAIVAMSSAVFPVGIGVGYYFGRTRPKRKILKKYSSALDELL